MNEFWFKPKLYGYGATPVTWEGWAVVAIFGAIVILCTVMLMVQKRNLWEWSTWSITLLVATAALVAVSWLKTDGPWRWSWGPSDVSEKRE
jgi:O-antigen/teichoic acid export membrane protein